MDTTAMGCIISAPVPRPRAMVDMPRMVVRAVISIGRRRMRPVSIRASRFSMPPMRSWLTQSMNTMPLFTTTPESTRKPSMDTMDRSMPVASSASRPPVKASGIVNMTMMGLLKLWNWATMIRKISSTATRTIHTRSSMMPMTVSFSPASSAL